MIELGKKQVLTIVKKVDFGVYLADNRDKEDEKILLPAKQVPEECELNDSLEVFVYRDSADRMIATVREPYITLGGTALLTVKEVGKFGAFLDWGLEKDLLLPFKEQTKVVQEGDQCIVALYTDKSSRLCATMKVYHYLETDSRHQKDDKVEGMVYEISDNFGVFVAVDDKYSGLIPKKEPCGNLCVGDRIEARVTEVKEDGKLSLSVREKAYIQMNDDAQKVLELMEASEGMLPFSDKADPETIREATGMSKNEFKRAIGNLYKQRLIVIDKDSIRKV